jgi:hypothetical protein
MSTYETFGYDCRTWCCVQNFGLRYRVSGIGYRGIGRFLGIGYPISEQGIGIGYPIPKKFENGIGIGYPIPKKLPIPIPCKTHTSNMDLSCIFDTIIS